MQIGMSATAAGLQISWGICCHKTFRFKLAAVQSWKSKKIPILLKSVKIQHI